MLKQGSTYKCYCGSEFYTSIDTEMHVQNCGVLTVTQRAALIFELNPLTLPAEAAKEMATPSISTDKAPKVEHIPATLGDSPYAFTPAGEQVIDELRM